MIGMLCHTFGLPHHWHNWTDFGDFRIYVEKASNQKMLDRDFKYGILGDRSM